MQRIRLWDLPTRLFHWLLVIAIAAAWWTGDQGGSWLIWHGRIGLFIVALIAFRLAWGIVGSTYARFSTFVRGPASILAYLRGHWRGLGHNPLGALSVLGLLGLTALQAASGLFAANDDIGYTGFLNALVSSSFAADLTRLHHLNFDLLCILIAMHIMAILFYVHIRKDNLISPMLSGNKTVENGEPARGGGIVALILALLFAGMVALFASGIWLPDFPAAPATSQSKPDW